MSADLLGRISEDGLIRVGVFVSYSFGVVRAELDCKAHRDWRGGVYFWVTEITEAIPAEVNYVGRHGKLLVERLEQHNKGMHPDSKKGRGHVNADFIRGVWKAGNQSVFTPDIPMIQLLKKLRCVPDTLVRCGTFTEIGRSLFREDEFPKSMRTIVV